jgi:DNA-binding Lrp family transcriptional regulator
MLRRLKMLNEVLKILEEDARRTPDEIAAMTGLKPEEVSSIIKKAEEDRLIIKYKAIVNWSKLQDEHILALIEVKTSPEKETGFDAIAETIARYPQVNTLYLVSGTYDLAVIAVGKTLQEIASFVTQKLAPLEGVQSTATHFLLKKYKEDGVILEGGEENRRQSVVL